jgi:hypothetical protein
VEALAAALERNTTLTDLALREFSSGTTISWNLALVSLPYFCCFREHHWRCWSRGARKDASIELDADKSQFGQFVDTEIVHGTHFDN